MLGNTHILYIKYNFSFEFCECKTKTLAFLQKSCELCGNPLPWTDKFKHLGIYLEIRIDGYDLDVMKIRIAQYIRKNIDFNQQLYFAYPYTKVEINSIYNSHYSSSPLWNLFGRCS